MTRVSEDISKDEDFIFPSPQGEDLEISESQPLKPLSEEGSHGDVGDFTASHGFDDHSDLFRKAALLLNQNADEFHIPGVTPQEQEALTRETTRKWRQPRILYLTIFACSLGAIEQGWAQTGMNGANLYIPTEFSLDSPSFHNSFILGAINCSLYLAQGLIGAWMSEPINGRLGRRGAIFAGTALCLAGNFGSAISWSWPALLSFRLILGAGLGLNSSTVSVFAAESAPVYIRGGLAVSWQMFTAFGIFLGFLANVTLALKYDYHPSTMWRLLLAAPIIPTIPLLMIIYLCPESPSWQIKRNNYSHAFTSLTLLRNTQLQAATELYSTYLSWRAKKHSNSDSRSYLTKLTSLFTAPRNRHALYASYTVMLTQQLSGINIIAFYSSTIFVNSGFSILTAHWASVIFGLVNFLGAFPAIWTMDKWGRRSLLLWTLPAMALTMAAAGWSFSIQGSNAQFVTLAGLIYLFCAIYSPGVGPVPCAYSAEVYPLAVREVGMSFAVCTAALWATVLSLTFPVLLEELGEQGSFELYAALNVVAWVLCWTFVRETKNVELEDMDSVFESSAFKFVNERWKDGMWSWGARRRLGKGWKEVRQDDVDAR